MGDLVVIRRDGTQATFPNDHYQFDAGTRTLVIWGNDGIPIFLSIGPHDIVTTNGIPLAGTGAQPFGFESPGSDDPSSDPTWDDVIDFFSSFGEQVGEWIAGLWEALCDLWDAIWDSSEGTSG